MSENEGEEKGKSPKILPPLMSVLMPVIARYQIFMAERDYESAFKELDLFFESLTRKPKRDVRETWLAYKAEAEKISGFGVTFNTQLNNLRVARTRFLSKGNNRIYGVFIEALDRHGYFEQTWQPLSDKDYKGMGESEEEEVEE